jgi:hypothetical protein
MHISKVVVAHKAINVVGGGGWRCSSRQIEESISILNFFPPNRGVDIYFEFLPAKIEESISILYFEFPPAKSKTDESICI